MGECGECTVCCTLSYVKELDKKPWDTCGHCILKKGCSIYTKRPNECKEFECAYYQGGTNIELRPDKCGIMFVKKNDRIFTGIVVPDTSITDMAKKQIVSFNKQGYSVVLLTKNEKPVLVVAPGHNEQEIKEEYIKLLKNGNL